MNQKFHCCVDCGPDVSGKCRLKGCQVDTLIPDSYEVEIGDVVFAAQDAQDRLGRTMFLCHTQANAGPDAEKVIEESLERLTSPELEEWDYKRQKFVPVKEPQRAKDLIIWAMIRVA